MTPHTVARISIYANPDSQIVAPVFIYSTIEVASALTKEERKYYLYMHCCITKQQQLAYIASSW
jgi:hypothetical protein